MFNKHFREFLELLEEKGVRYLVVGGYAVGVHGFPRYTGDLDVFVSISNENSKKLIEVFNEFGFSDIGLTESDFLEDETVVEIGREPIKVQVLTGIDGVTFDVFGVIPCYRGHRPTPRHRACQCGMASRVAVGFETRCDLFQIKLHTVWRPTLATG